jgi:hypothetical protein
MGELKVLHTWKKADGRASTVRTKARWKITQNLLAAPRMPKPAWFVAGRRKGLFLNPETPAPGVSGMVGPLYLWQHVSVVRR